MSSLETNNFSLVHSLFSGQCFGWKKIGNWHYGEILGTPAKLRQDGNVLFFKGTGEEEISRYLGLEDDVSRVYGKICEDPVLEKAVEKFKGLRILKQDPWVCSISFLCSISCNIPGIEVQLDKLKARYGRCVFFEGEKMYLFPEPEVIANTQLKELRKCGVGFRDRYIKGLGRRMSELDMEELRRSSYEQAKAGLMESFGIGPKVADCICLFSLDKSEAFPIDIWIQRAMEAYYGKGIKSMFPKTKFSYKDIQRFAWTRWGKNAGYAQQFLYVYSKNDLKVKKRRK